MKNLILLIISIFISITLIAKDTKITIIGDNITIKEAFEQIEAKSKFAIAYNQSKFNADQRLTISIKNATIEKILISILKGTGFTYKINGSHIIIKEINQISKSSEKEKNKKPTQTIRGIVKDAASEQSIPHATIILLNTYPKKGASTDPHGNFRLDRVPIGRYDIEVSAIGYEPAIIKEVLLTSAKESYNIVMLREELVQLDEVVVRPKVNKEQPLNQMSLAGGRMFSVEEASRYAGGFDDPARLVTSFAGVSGTTSNNSISIRGNSPQFSQWRLEGVEIPNPTHFADMVQVGGGIITGLSSQVMGNSDFFNSAFPAQYSNAISGIFDMSLRNGNNQKYEHTFQVGVMGLDFASEGPINRETGSSYIINYRYSITGLISELTADLDLKFQDLSFKLNFPTRKGGTFSIWGLGLIDNMGTAALEDPSLWKTVTDRQNSSLESQKFTTGIGHKIFVGNGAYIHSSIAATYSDYRVAGDILELEEPFAPIPFTDIKSQELNITFNSYLNKKFSARHTNRTGIAATGIFYDLEFNGSPTFLGPTTSIMDPMVQIAKGSASDATISAFSSSMINITDRLSTNIGVTAQLFTLNNSWSLEPRVSIKYQVAPRHSLAIAYGLHSKREKLDYYYIKTPETGDELINKDLTLAKANHLVLSYDWNITDNIHLKIEPYYQLLYDVPVEPGTSFSVINHDLFYLSKALVNDGKGKNYGLDITVEQYFTKGFYWMITGSVFDSKYLGGDGVWRNTRYNRKFITNALIGKEWACGKNDQNLFSANVKFLYQGGRYYTPVNLEASIAESQTVWVEDKAYSEKFAPTFTADFTVSYRINKEKVSHEFAIKVLNATGTIEKFNRYYDPETKTIKDNEVMIALPNISYKIYF